MISSHVLPLIRHVPPASPQEQPEQQDQKRPTKRDPRNTDAPKVDTVRATTPPAYPFPQSHNVKQPGDQSPTQRPAPGKKNHKGQISPAPAAQSLILAMMLQV